MSFGLATIDRPAPGPDLQNGAPYPRKRANQQHTDRLGDRLPEGALLRLGTVRLRSASVWQLTFSPDGHTLASLDGTLWEMPSGRRRGQFELPCQDTSALRFSPQGRLLAVGGDESAVWLWDVADRKRLQRLKRFAAGEDFSVYYWLFLSPDGKTLAIAIDGVQLWDVGTGKRLRHISPPRAEVRAVAFSPDSKLLATGHRAASGGVAVRLWDPTTGKEVRAIQGESADVHRLTFTPDGKGLVVACEDETVRLWDVASGKEVRRFERIFCQPDALAVSPDGKLLAAGGPPGVIWVLDMATGRAVTPSGALRAAVLGVAFAPDGKTLATAGADQDLCLWDATTGARMRTLALGQPAGWAVAFAPDGRALACVEAAAQLWASRTAYGVRLWDPASGKVLHRWTGPGPAQLGLCLAVAPQGDLVAAGCVRWARNGSDWTGEVAIWNRVTGRDVRSLPATEGGVTALAFSPDGQLLAGCGGRMIGGLWDVRTGRMARRLEVPSRPELKGSPRADAGEPRPTRGPATGLAFAPDGKTVVGLEDHRWLVLWETATGKVRLRRMLHPPRGTYGLGLALSPNGRLLATVDPSFDVSVWDLETVRLLRRFTGHRGTVLALAFSPDGKRLASASADTTVLIWDVVGLAPARRPGPLKPAELAALWSDLAGEDAPAAYQAILKLGVPPAEAVPFLRARLRPAPRLAARQVAQLVADLDDRRFAVREAASAKLAARLDLAEPALRRAMAGQPSPDLRRRLEALLAKVHGPDWLRSWRALEALEHAGTPEARKALEELATGDPDAEFTREAAAAAKRLASRAAR
jgi:WD40 repeat protein